jgi:serine/threonine-protein kinase HipA
LDGKKRRLKRKHFEQLGEGLGLSEKQINAAFQRMIKNKPKAFSWIDRSFLSDAMKTSYKEVLNLRYQQLELK